MAKMFLQDFSLYIPKHQLDQEKALDWIAFMHAQASHGNDKSQSEIRQLLNKIGLGRGKIEKRYFQMSDILIDDIAKMSIYNLFADSRGSSLQNKMQVFLDETLHICRNFYEHTPPKSHIIHVSCTGYTSPSPAQRIAAEHDLYPITVTHAYHMGCYGSLPAIRIAKGFNEDSDIIHTEFCSLHMNPTVLNMGQLVIESLFADGFIKYSSTKLRRLDHPSFEVVCMQEQIVPTSVDDMKWICADGGFLMYLSKDVPMKIARALHPYLKSLADKALVDFAFLLSHAIFAIHPGGPKIIEQVKEIYGLHEWQIAHSREVLKKRGNMSSATLPHIWETVLHDANVPNETMIVSMAFGPGLTISGAIFIKHG